MQYKIKTAVTDDLMLTQSSIGANSNNTPTISSCIVQRPTHPLLHCEEGQRNSLLVGLRPWTGTLDCTIPLSDHYLGLQTSAGRTPQRFFLQQLSSCNCIVQLQETSGYGAWHAVVGLWVGA
jgi:hypothetical protein